MNDFNYFRPNPKPAKTGKKPKKPLPKRSKKYKSATQIEKEHLLLIKSMGCIVCPRPAPSEAHHICVAGRRVGHFYTLPLCHEHHEGTELSIGNTKKKFIEKFGTEFELLVKVNKLIRLDKSYNNK